MNEVRLNVIKFYIQLVWLNKSALSNMRSESQFLFVTNNIMLKVRGNKQYDHTNS